MDMEEKEKMEIESLMKEMSENQDGIKKIEEEKKKLLEKKEAIAKKVQAKKKEMLQKYIETANKIKKEHNKKIADAQKVYLEEKKKIQEEYMNGIKDKMAERKKYTENLKLYPKGSALALLTNNEIARIDDEIKEYKSTEGAKAVEKLNQKKKERDEIFAESKKSAREILEKERETLAIYGIKVPEIKFKDEVVKEKKAEEEKKKEEDKTNPEGKTKTDTKPREISVIYSSRDQLSQGERQAKPVQYTESIKNDTDECYVNISYNAKNDCYFIVNKANGEVTEIPRSEIRTYGLEENRTIIDKANMEDVDFVEDIDMNIFQALLIFDKENGTNKAKEYKQYILSGMKSKEFLVKYDLRGLYSKSSEISKEDKQKILETAEHAKKSKTGKVKKGFKTGMMSLANKIKNYLEASDLEDDYDFDDYEEYNRENNDEQEELETREEKKPTKTKGEDEKSSEKSDKKESRASWREYIRTSAQSEDVVEMDEKDPEQHDKLGKVILKTKKANSGKVIEEDLEEEK